MDIFIKNNKDLWLEPVHFFIDNDNLDSGCYFAAAYDEKNYIAYKHVQNYESALEIFEDCENSYFVIEDMEPKDLFLLPKKFKFNI